MSSHEFCMFSAIYRYNIAKTGEHVKELSLSFLSIKTEFLIVKNLSTFGPHCNILPYTQNYELKFSIEMNFDTLISNLKAYFQYEIVMTSL